MRRTTAQEDQMKAEPETRKTRLMKIQSDAYTGPRGELRWKANKAVISPSWFCERGFMSPDVIDITDVMPASQAAEYNAYVAQEARAYAEAQRHTKPSAEELFEMRAAFGRGVTVVDVFTGRRTRL